LIWFITIIGYVSQISNKLKKYKYANGFKFVIIYLIPITISLKEIVSFATNQLTTFVIGWRMQLQKVVCATTFEI